MKIIQYPHKTLRKKAQTVKQITPQIEEFARHLLETLVPQKDKALGVGLAANQVNQLHRIFICLMPDNQFTICLNPHILKSSKKMLSKLPQKDQFLEGCLSIPGYYGFVDRPVKIKVKYQTLTGLNKTKTLTPPHSSYFQHELDHLNGILFLDHLKKNQAQLYQVNSKGQLEAVSKVTS